MNRTIPIISLLLVTGAVAWAARPEPIIIERGPNHRVLQHATWQTNASGQVVDRTNIYTELATGLHYQENGEWKESRAEIEILPNRAGAVARSGGHKVIFGPNLNSEGVIDLETSDGQRLRSHVLGLGYFDTASGKSVLIAEVKSSIGQLVGKNQLLYPDAFVGVLADVRYTYQCSGFEQDVIIREQPPGPQQFGLDPRTTRLEVFTEFLNPPLPTKTLAPIPGTPLVDERLGFGRTKIGQGRAFPLGDAASRSRSVPTSKTWLEADGRTILIEEVEFRAVEKELQQLPPPKKTAAIKHKQQKWLVKAQRQIPARIAKQKSKDTIRLASAPLPTQGFVLDYITLDGAPAEYTFQSNTTYFVSAGFWVDGDVTVEAGAVVKYADEPDYGGWGLSLGVGGNLISPATGTATFTSMHDDSQGETIAGSTGAPDRDVGALYFEFFNGTPATLKNLNLHFAQIGVVSAATSSNWLQDCLFDYCETGVMLSYGSVALTNVNFAGNVHAIDYPYLDPDSCNVICSQVTAGPGGYLLHLDNYTSLNQVSLLVDRCCLTSLGQDIKAFGTSITTAGGTFAWALGGCDSDADGMPDDWETYYFGDLTQTGAGDYDGDGVSNLAEYLQGRNPNAGAAPDSSNLTQFRVFTPLK
jgi:hypothetical protein